MSGHKCGILLSRIRWSWVAFNLRLHSGEFSYKIFYWVCSIIFKFSSDCHTQSNFFKLWSCFSKRLDIWTRSYSQFQMKVISKLCHFLKKTMHFLPVLGLMSDTQTTISVESYCYWCPLHQFILLTQEPIRLNLVKNIENWWFWKT